MVTIAFSWDDGAVEDLKLMDIEMRFSIPSLFFIPAKNPERPVLSPEDVKTLYRNNFEIGAHTYSHYYLTKLPIKDAEEEILTGKDYLEQLLGNDVPHFSFPGGMYNNELTKISRDHFRTARTADTGSTITGNSFLVKPTFHFFDRGKVSIVYNSMKHKSALSLLTIKNMLCPGYFNYMKQLIDDLDKSPSIYRIIIWGHSWEIEEQNLWKQLEGLFRWINDRQSISIKSYSDLVIH